MATHPSLQATIRFSPCSRIAIAWVKMLDWWLLLVSVYIQPRTQIDFTEFQAFLKEWNAGSDMLIVDLDANAGHGSWGHV